MFQKLFFRFVPFIDSQNVKMTSEFFFLQSLHPNFLLLLLRFGSNKQFRFITSISIVLSRVIYT